MIKNIYFKFFNYRLFIFIWTGSVYVFGTSDSGGTWSELDMLLPADTTAGYQFGRALAVHFGIMVVGAWKASSDAGHNKILLECMDYR